MRHFSECNLIQTQHSKTAFENETQGFALYSRTIIQETLFGEKGILSFSCSVVSNNLKPFTVRLILTAFTTKKPSQSFTIEKESQGLISFSFNSSFQLIYWTRLFFPKVFHRPSRQRTRKWPQCRACSDKASPFSSHFRVYLCFCKTRSWGKVQQFGLQ